jgi:hypothetical protein
MQGEPKKLSQIKDGVGMFGGVLVSEINVFCCIKAFSALVAKLYALNVCDNALLTIITAGVLMMLANLGVAHMQLALRAFWRGHPHE